MAKVVTMGEIMLRLSSPGYQRFAQASEFEINYGGAEANVAVSLAQLGHDVTYISKIPSNAIGEAAIATLKKTGVDCRYIARGGKRLGVYFLENGASVRPSNVVYDRADSSITQASAEEFDFDQIFDGVCVLSAQRSACHLPIPSRFFFTFPFSFNSSTAHMLIRGFHTLFSR